MSVDQENDDFLEFAAEDHLDLLQSNTLALALGTISFLRSQGIPATEWTNELGTIFARGWDTDEPWAPEDFMDATILNLTAFGGEAIQAEFGDDEATALISRFPDVERCAALGLENVDGDILFEVITPIARACGLRYRWQREGENVRIAVFRVGDAQ
jgi:hypothetical protein